MGKSEKLAVRGELIGGIRTVSVDEFSIMKDEHENWLSSQGADGHRGNLFYSDLRKLAFSDLSLTSADLSVCDLRKVKFNGAMMNHSSFYGSDLEGAYMRSGKFERCSFLDANLTNARGQSANFNGACFMFANLGRADFSEADLHGADFDKAKCLNTSFKGADLRKANFENAQCHGASFHGAILCGIDLRIVGIRQDQIEGAFGDRETKMTDGLSLISYEDHGKRLTWENGQAITTDI